MGLNSTPNSNRLHIGIFGKRNSGKSSLINSITNQNIALVSDVAGTTTDPVYKTMEINGIGPCVFIDTAGFDDEGDLGVKRVEMTNKVIDKTDIAIMIINDTDIYKEIIWHDKLIKNKIPVIFVVNKVDILTNVNDIKALVKESFNKNIIEVSANTKLGIDRIKEELIRCLPEGFNLDSIVGHLVKSNDVVMLVMPQDIQAPKGRLILPQVQTIRDLLDNKCIVIATTTENIDDALKALVKPPKLIITDSQVFKTVYEKKPKESLLTSFSVLFAALKGDIYEFIAGANAIDLLNENSRILIAEACTHAPLSEDIGREKIPNMLRKKIGENLKIDVVSGVDFPEDLKSYDLIIHCASCMFNKKYVLSRINKAKEQNVPITNYGIVIAKMVGILEKITV
ncbi:MAG TPA: [FeFe] hydrogenase H-cluster maturation GTPase HydF [Clostridiales bacterium]|nr:[FeFe] hydrogenase H-cluster maturation GTPase HydF [Clostridiales bacterium]